MAVKFQKIDRAHQVYKNAAGKRVPGCSTVAGCLDKSHLVGWANRMGLQNINTGKYVDGLADAGTLTHYMAQCVFEEKERDQAYMDEYSKVNLDRATVSFDKFIDWYSQHTIEVIAVELKLISEELQVGGQIDVLATVDGVLTLIDLKTSKALYGPGDDKWIQAAGYDLILEENGYKPEEVRILRIGREEGEGFEYALMPHRQKQRDLFRLCRRVYELRKEIKK